MKKIGVTEEWSIIKVCLKSKWPELTYNDLTYSGDEEALLDGIQKRTGAGREELVEVVSRNFGFFRSRILG